jgi:hypothetical protein
MTTISSIRRHTRPRGGMRLAFHMLPVLAILATSTWAYAGDPAAARAQLEAGYQLKEQGNYAEALPHFVESLRLDLQLKTLTNLADCEEHLGQLVDAQLHWVMARDRAGVEGNDRFKASAEARLTALESRMPKLVIKLAPDAPPKTEVTRDGTVLGPVSLGTPLPANTGDHTVIARAPGFAPQTFTVTLAERDQKELVVRPGAAVPLDAAVVVPVGSVATPSGPVRAWSTQKTGALVAAGVGLVGVGLGVGFGLETGSHWSSAQRECGSGCGPSSPAQSERSTAMTDATISDVSFVVAGVAVAGAVALWFTAPNAKEAPRPLDAIHLVPMLGKHDGGLAVLAAF